MSVYEKLMIIQNKLKVPKSQYNNFGKYNYRNCEDILEAVKPFLNENKAVVMLTDNIEFIGTRFYVKATAKFTDIETGECISVDAFAREEEVKKGMDGSQITGAAGSYARKYALNGLFAIDDTKDSDTTNTGQPDAGQPDTSLPKPKKTVSDAQIKRLFAIAAKQGIKGDDIKLLCNSKYKVDIKELTNDNYAEFCSCLENNPQPILQWLDKKKGDKNE